MLHFCAKGSSIALWDCASWLAMDRRLGSESVKYFSRVIALKAEV